jgi:hypothetical protein
MAEAAFDPFALGTGLATEMSGEITEAWFTFDNMYNAGNTAILKLKIADPVIGEQTLLYPCGDNWEPYENGARVRHNSGNARNFNHQSGVGLLLAAAADAGLTDMLRDRGMTPFEAKLWEGLNLRFENKEFTYTDRKTKEERSYSRMLPTGLNNGSSPAPAAAVADAEVATGTGFDLSSIQPATRGKLKAVAAGCSNNDEFIEKVFTASFELSEDIENAVVNNADLFNALKG